MEELELSLELALGSVSSVLGSVDGGVTVVEAGGVGLPTCSGAAGCHTKCAEARKPFSHAARSCEGKAAPTGGSLASQAAIKGSEVAGAPVFGCAVAEELIAADVEDIGNLLLRYEIQSLKVTLPSNQGRQAVWPALGPCGS